MEKPWTKAEEEQVSRERENLSLTAPTLRSSIPFPLSNQNPRLNPNPTSPIPSPAPDPTTPKNYNRRIRRSKTLATIHLILLQLLSRINCVFLVIPLSILPRETEIPCKSGFRAVMHDCLKVLLSVCWIPILFTVCWIPEKFQLIGNLRSPGDSFML